MPLKNISLGLVLAVLACMNAYAQDGTWDRYKQNFLTEDGRIVDPAQDNTSHSEGQGYGLWLAVLQSDRAAFDRIWQWTRNNLQVRADKLFAWHWGKRPNNEWAVLDLNNATDGDIVIAYALLLGQNQWKTKEYGDEALKIIRDIRTRLSVVRMGRTFLLPGYFGFTGEGGVLLNPSYLILPAFRLFSQADDAAFWDKVYSDGLFLIDRCCFGSLCLPADWVMLEGDRFAPAPGKAPYFGSNAIRILLALSQEDKPRFPRGVSALLERYQRTGELPQWVDLEKDSFSLRPAAAGYYAIFGLVAEKLGDRSLAKRLFDEARAKLKAEKAAYYSFSLYLLATAGSRQME